MSEKTSIEVQPQEPRIFVGVRRTVDASDIGAACAEVLPRLARWLGERGVAIDGMPATVYHAHDETAGRFDLQPGFFVKGRPEVSGDISVVETPGGDAAVALHRGPYEGLGDTWGAVAAWFREQGRPPGAPCWEIYLDDPGQTPPDQLRTQIVWPLA